MVRPMSPWFGDGHDGKVTFNGRSRVLGIKPSRAGVYSLERDLHLADGSKITGRATIETAGHQIFCDGTLLIGKRARVVAGPAKTQIRSGG